MQKYKSLEPIIESYTYETGEEMNLVTLKGTIPINYRKNWYHTPVAIYFPTNFPDSPPICYVRPTSTMSIKESKYVDNQGKVNIPSWTPTTSINSLLDMLVIFFSEIPPLYQKPRTTIQNSVYSWNQPSPVQSTPTSGSYPYNNPYAVKSTPGAYPGSSWYNDKSQSAATSRPGYPTSASNSSISSALGTNSSASRSPCELTDNDIRASLVSAVGDRLRRRVNELIERYNTEMEVIKKTEEDLNKGKKELDSILKKMSNDTLTLQKTKQQLEQFNQQLDQAITKAETEQEKFNVDDAYGPAEPLFKQ